MKNVNKNAIRDVALKALRAFEKEAEAEAKKIFEKNKKEMIQEFNDHPITQEIKGGPQAPNSSNTLGGYGNLFSYIGFPMEDGDPTKEVEQHLKKGTLLLKVPTVTQDKDKVIFNFKISVPDDDSIKGITPMPFEPGRSWVYAIERGISGLSYYIYKKFLPSSRSGTGVQADNQIRSLTYKPVKYFSQILNNFKAKFK